jgi:hypothetical protein
MTRACAHACAVGLALVVGAAGDAAAQAKTPRVEVSAGALFVGGYAAGSQEANLIGNQSGAPPYTVFKSESRVGSTAGIEARVGVRVSQLFTIEGGVFAARPQLTTRLSADIEGAPDARVSEDLSVYIIDAALMTSFGSRSGSRLTPFFRIGAGYVRELHENNMLVETGKALHAGGGVTVWFDPRRRVGVRADARVYVISGGIELDAGSRTQGAAAGAVVFAF